MRFSGHETFCCRVNWLTKGISAVGKNESIDFVALFNEDDLMLELGVGKNMVGSIRHWLISFGLIMQNKPTDIFDNLYNKGSITLDVDRIDVLLLLNYQLCATNYATIYHFFFKVFIQSRPSGLFTSNELHLSLKSYIVKHEEKLPSEKTLLSDLKVFIEMYNDGTNNARVLEDQNSSILSPLGFITETGKDVADSFFRFNFLSAEEKYCNVLIYLILRVSNYNKRDSKVLTASELFDSVGVYFGFLRDEFYVMLALIARTERKIEFEYTKGLGVQNVKLSSGISIEKYNVLYD